MCALSPCKSIQLFLTLHYTENGAVSYTHTHCIAHCTLQRSFMAKLRGTTPFYSVLSLCLPSHPHRSKTSVYSTHDASSLLNIYFRSLSLSFSLGKNECSSVCLCLFVYVLLCVFSSASKWLLNSVQTTIKGWSEPDG